MKRRRLSTFKKILKALEHSSTCAKIKVACIVIKKGRVISTGWNGVTSAMTHCEEVFKGKELGQPGDKTRLSDEHHHFATHNEIHAEMNAIAFAARYGTKTHGADLMCSWSPCLECSKIIVAAGIKKVYYTNVYGRQPEGIEFLEKNNVKTEYIGKKNVKLETSK